MGHLTKDFDSTEFECKCGCGLNNIQPEAVRRAQLYRNAIGFANVDSGCRCKKHNKEVGGADNSLHLPGWATDLSFPNHNIQFVYSQAYKIWLPLESGGLILYDSFIHQDIGVKRLIDRRVKYKEVAYV